MKATDLIIAFITQPAGAVVQRQRGALTIHLSDRAEFRLWIGAVIIGAAIMTAIDLTEAARQRMELAKILTFVLWTVLKCAW